MQYLAAKGHRLANRSLSIVFQATLQIYRTCKYDFLTVLFFSAASVLILIFN